MTSARIFIFCLVPVIIAGAFGSFFGTEAIESWYQILQKPNLTPPDKFFSIAWGIIYILIIFSFVSFFKNSSSRKDTARAKIYLYVQLFLQVLWNFTFFYIGQFLAGVIVLIALLGLVWYNISLFWKNNKFAAILLVPYFLWLGLATWINIDYVLLHGYSLNF